MKVKVKPLVSVVVPVYNVEKYLDSCIDSLLNQTYSNIELVIVNDGSTDGSLSILQNYAEYSQIKLINIVNSGVSVARNIGLQNVSGEFLMFVDSDDWIDKETVEECVINAQKSNADVVFFGYVREFEQMSKKRYLFDRNIEFGQDQVKELHRRIIGPIDNELRNPALVDSYGTAAMKLYRTSIIKINRVEFLDIKKIGSAEDVLFNIDVFQHVKRAFYINKCFYHYRKFNLNSITTVYKPDLVKQRLVYFEKIENIILYGNLGKDFERALLHRTALSVIGLGLNELSSNHSLRNKIKKITQILSIKKYSVALRNIEMSYFPLHWKVFFYFAKHNISIGVFSLLLAVNYFINRKK